MADPFIDLHEDQVQHQLAALLKPSCTSDHNNNKHNTTSSYPNFESSTNAHSPIASSFDPNMFDTIEELMVPDFFHDGTQEQTVEPESISIWDLIASDPCFTTAKQEPEPDLSFLKQQEDPSLPCIKEEVTNVDFQDRHETLESSFQFRPVATQETYRYKSQQQPYRRKYDISPFSPEEPPPPPPSSSARFKSSGLDRKRSISKMPLNELYDVMGLSHDHQLALEREEQIMGILERHGFEVGEKTWIRDTEEPARRSILEAVYSETFSHFGYSKRLLEAIIRRGTYARMQSNLRRRRRRRRRIAATQV